MKRLLKYLEFLKQLRNPKIKSVTKQNYQIVFRSPAGEEVLVDLMRHCKFGADVSNSKDVNRTFFELGKQDALRYVLNKIGD